VRRCILPLAGICLLIAAVAPGSAAGTAVYAKLDQRTLARRVIATWARVTLPQGTFKLVTVSWPLGSRYRLHTARTSPQTAIRAGGLLRRRRITAWASASAPAGLVAAASGDFAAYQSGWARPSGVDVSARRLLHVPSGSAPPSVGFTAEGQLRFGTVTPIPVTVRLDGTTVPVGALGARPPTGTIGVYLHHHQRVTLSRGYAAVVFDRSPFESAIRVPRVVMPDATSRLAALHRPGAPIRILAATPRRPRHPRIAQVPARGAVVVYRTGGRVARAVRAALASHQVRVVAADAAWAHVTDTMGGKPLLVSAGNPVTAKPWTMTPYQWEAPASRIAIAQTADGRGMIAILNEANRSSAGVGAATFAQLLAEQGVTNAIGLDAGPAPSLYSPRYLTATCVGVKGWCYQSTPREPAPPLTAALTVAP
jgi:phosphodiester glycosidase